MSKLLKAIHLNINDKGRVKNYHLIRPVECYNAIKMVREVYHCATIQDAYGKYAEIIIKKGE